MRNLGARGKGGMREEKRHQLMQNLFGDQSEEEIESEQEVNRGPEYPSDEGEGEAEFDGEGEGEVEGQGETEVESEWDLQDIDPDGGESERERVQISPKRDMRDQMMETGGKDGEDNDEPDEYGQRVVTSRRREVIASISERSDENHYAENEDEEVDQATILSNSLSEEEDKDPLNVSHSTAEIRDVFGNSDEDEQADYMAQNYHDQDSHRSLAEEEESYEKDLRPEDMVPNEDAQYASEEDKIDQIQKVKPVGPPLDLEIPLRPPPGQPDKMNMIKVSNIMGIDPKPFDPKTYVEEEVFVTDESGANKRIRLEDNIVRWRSVRNRDGPISYESNARFVRWSDSSLQLLIGNEVLDISVQGAQHDQTHLFLRHGKGILQSQGRLLRKMRFMPSSLSSKSHRRLTALVDSRHKKVYKVKNCITDIDPEKDKEEKEKALGQSIRASDLLHRKRVKVNRKYALPVERGCQLSPGFLEDALEEDDVREDPYESRHSAARRPFEEDLDVQAEQCILNAKKSRVMEDVRCKPSVQASHPSRRPVEYSESEREESEYESTGDEGEQSPVGKRSDEPELEEEVEEEEEEVEETGANGASGDKEDEVPRRRNKASGRVLKRKEPESDPDSAPRKSATHRRMAVVYDSDED